MDPLRLVFLLLVIGAGGAVEWILLLRADFGKVPFPDWPVRSFWVLPFAYGRDSPSGWPPLDLVCELLVLALVVLELCDGSSVVGCLPSMVEVEGCSAKSRNMTADGLSPRISCSLPMFGVCSLFWTGEDGGLMLQSAAWWTEV